MRAPACLLLLVCAIHASSLAPMRRVLVTGGSGFIGRHLITRLVSQGVQVHAIARSDAAKAAVELAGAVGFKGSLHDEQFMARAAAGCDTLIHGAGVVDSPDSQLIHLVNVEGVHTTMQAARRANVSRSVHVSSTAACFNANGDPLVSLDESVPLPSHGPSWAPYASSKNAAEKAALEHSEHGMSVVAVRLPMVWGKDDTLILPPLVENALENKLVWPGGGKSRLSTCHIDNAVDGLIKAATKGTPGSAYFITDGDPVTSREFVEGQINSLGVQAPEGIMSVPSGLLFGVAAAVEAVCGALGLTAPIRRETLVFFAQDHWVSDGKARRELGYESSVSRAQGLAEMPNWQEDVAAKVKAAKVEL